MKLSPELKRLNAAVAAGNHAEVRVIVAQNPVLIRDPRPLSQAALHGQSRVVKALLDLGADPNVFVPSHDNYRPLHRAIEHKGVAFLPGHLECVQTLLAAGADPMLRSTWRNLTALGLAGATGEPKMIEHLRMHLPAQTLAQQKDIFTAALLADADTVTAILSGAANAVSVSDTAAEATIAIAKSRDVNGMTPLHCAAHCGLRNAESQRRLVRIASALLDAGADPDSCEKIGPYHKLSVLHFAGRDNVAVVQTLLERGANPNLGFGAALWHKPYPLAELFLKHGADVNLREDDLHPADEEEDAANESKASESQPPLGTPLLNSRIHWNLPDVVLLLLKHGADPNQTDAHGNTALHKAASRGINPKVVEALLKHGANPLARNALGETAQDIASKKGRKMATLR